jgi:hypothetical protein
MPVATDADLDNNGFIDGSTDSKDNKLLVLDNLMVCRSAQI